MRRGKDRVAALDSLDVDRSAVERSRRDPAAFEALYRKYVAQVYSFALYELRDPHAAEDVTALVFLRALAGLPHFHEQSEGLDSSFRVWLFQIARNALSNEKRHARRHPTSPIDLALEYPAGDDTHAVASNRIELARAWELIERLPADRRRALVLRFVNEMSTREIGEILGRSEGATRVLIHRSLQSVARQMSRAEKSGVRFPRKRAAN
ncbi:MAG TPA: RNA polymerase sigma factor [Candidatus Limnocylindrales bacterium]